MSFLRYGPAPSVHAPRKTWPLGVTHVWTGVDPPWYQYLGEYRDFTPEEKAAGEVCKPIGTQNV